MVICGVKCDTKDDPVLQNSSQEPPMSSKYDCVLDALIIMLGSWKLAYNSRLAYYVDSWCQIWYQRCPNLQNSSQKPSISSKCDSILDALLIKLGHWKSAYNSIMTYYDYLWCQILYQWWPNPPKLQSGTINILHVWP